MITAAVVIATAAILLTIASCLHAAGEQSRQERGE
jgi:hypothetical protein